MYPVLRLIFTGLSQSVHTMHVLGQYLMVRIKRVITFLTSIVILV